MRDAKKNEQSIVTEIKYSLAEQNTEESKKGYKYVLYKNAHNC